MLLRLAVVMSLLLIGTLAIASYAPPQRQDVDYDAARIHPQRHDFDYATRIRPEHLSDAELSKALDLAQSAGISTVNFEVSWARLDRGDSDGSKRTYDWQDADRLVDAAEARDMEVTFLLTQTPDWVHPYLREAVPARDDRMWTAPKGNTELRHWSDFVGDVVGRYRGQVSHFEIWNEPNLDDFWKPYPDVDEYAPLLRAAYLAAKDANPQAKIVFGGLSENDLGYLSEYYSVVKASYPGAASHNYFFDILGVHPYSKDRSPDLYMQDAIYQGQYGEVDGNFLGVVHMKELMDDEVDLGKDLYLSEYGFSTSDTWMKAVPDRRRALYLKRAYKLARSLPYVDGLSWYAYHPNAHDAPEWTIVGKNFKPSLTFRAYKQVTGAETSTANLTINLPEIINNCTYSIEPQLKGLHKTDVYHWELYVDGVLTEERSATPIKWDTCAAEPGPHEVMVAAYTTGGSVWHSNIAETNVTGNPRNQT
jgi:polysaccharide biosynthesis protein PslG